MHPVDHPETEQKGGCDIHSEWDVAAGLSVARYIAAPFVGFSSPATIYWTFTSLRRMTPSLLLRQLAVKRQVLCSLQVSGTCAPSMVQGTFFFFMFFALLFFLRFWRGGGV